LKPGGRIAYTTIVVADDLSKSRHRRAVRAGPRAISSTRPMGVLTEAARFERVVVTDVTKEFIETAQAWIDAFGQRQRQLRPLLGPEFDERQTGRRNMVAAAGEGLLKRLLVSATSPNL
jgi:hypothetical protein